MTCIIAIFFIILRQNCRETAFAQQNENKFSFAIA